MVLAPLTPEQQATARKLATPVDGADDQGPAADPAFMQTLFSRLLMILPPAPRRPLPLAQGAGALRQVRVLALRAYRRSMRRLPHQELVSHQAPPLRRLAERHLAPGSAHRLAAWSHRHLAHKSGFVPVARSAVSPPRVVLLVHSFTSSVAYASWVPRGGWPSASLHSQCSEFVDYGLGGSD